MAVRHPVTGIDWFLLWGCQTVDFHPLPKQQARWRDMQDPRDIMWRSVVFSLTLYKTCSYGGCLTHLSLDNICWPPMPAISQTVFSSAICEWKVLYSNFSEVCSQGSNCQWGRIGLGNGFVPNRRQAIIWTNPGILLIGPLGTNFNEILFEIWKFSFKKIKLRMSSAKWQLFCL